MQQRTPIGETSEDLSVLWIIPAAWEDELEVRPMHDSIPISAWLQTIAEGHMEIVTLPYETLLAGESPWAGGHVLAVEAENGRHFFAIPAAAIPLLQGLIPPRDYHELVRQTPLLAGS